MEQYEARLKALEATVTYSTSLIQEMYVATAVGKAKEAMSKAWEDCHTALTSAYLLNPSLTGKESDEKARLLTVEKLGARP